MARMFPSVLPEDVLNSPGRRAECDFYELCQDLLPAETVVVYGYRWLDPLDKHRAIEGEADFTIIDPRFGILVLELKGGIIRRDAATGTYFSKELRGPREHQIKDPGYQAANSRRAVVSKLEASRPWRTWRQKKHPNRDRSGFPAGFGVVFPDCTAGGNLIAGDINQQNSIDASHKGDLAARVEQLFSFLVGRNPCLPITREGMNAVLDVLAYDGTLRRPLAIEMADEDRQLMKATQQQLQILSVLRLHNRVLIRGGAGTGKTLLAIEKARRAAVQGRPTLLLCYNELLGEYLKETEAAKCGAHATTFHGLCMQISGLRPPSRSPNGTADLRRFFDEELPAAAYEQLLMVEPEQRYQTVVIDEAQDFLPTWYDIIRQLMEPDAAGMDPEYFLALDEDQIPPGRLNRLPENLSPFPLDENLRNTQAIFASTKSLRKSGPLTCAGPEGEPIRKQCCDHESKLPDIVGRELEHYIEQGEVRPQDVVVLVGSSLDRSLLAAKGGAGQYKLSPNAAGNSSVQIESVWRYKGLEKPVVILAELDGVAANKQALYVGGTRAKLRLSVVGTAACINQFT